MKKRTKHGHSRQSTDRSAAVQASLWREVASTASSTKSLCFPAGGTSPDSRAVRALSAVTVRCPFLYEQISPIRRIGCLPSALVALSRCDHYFGRSPLEFDPYIVERKVLPHKPLTARRQRGAHHHGDAAGPQPGPGRRNTLGVRVLPVAPTSVPLIVYGMCTKPSLGGVYPSPQRPGPVRLA